VPEELEVNAVFFIGCDPQDGLMLLAGDAMVGGGGISLGYAQGATVWLRLNELPLIAAW
jgi:hypothetical protein